MKKYLKILPLILFPYAYLIFFCTISYLPIEIKDIPNIQNIDLFDVLIILYDLWALILSLWSAISGLKRYTSTEAAKMNFAVKCLQIPAYLFHFLMGAAGAVTGIWGFGFLFLAIIIDLGSIFLSGLFAIGSVRRLKKEGVLSSGKAFWAGFGSFIYCVDVIVAIILVQLCKKKFPQEESKLYHGTERIVRIRKTLAYLSALLMALYPYALYASRIISSALVITAVVYALLIMIIVIRSAYDAFSLHSPLAAARMNLAVKGLQVPAYIINFFSGALLGVGGALLGVGMSEGLIPIAFFVILDVIMIALSGVYAIGCIRRLKKEGILSSETAILAGIGSFIFVLDVIVAIVLVTMCKKKNGTTVGKADPPPLPSAPQKTAPAQNEAAEETAPEE